MTSLHYAGMHTHSSVDLSLSFSCKRDPHEPLTCELLTKWRKKCDDESETANWFHINTKVRWLCLDNVDIDGDGGGDGSGDGDGGGGGDGSGGGGGDGDGREICIHTDILLL